MEPVELIQKLQSIKKFQNSRAYENFQTRREQLENLYAQILSRDDENFRQQKNSLLPKLQKLLVGARTSSDLCDPTGVILFYLPRIWTYHAFIENLFRTVLAGDVGIFLFPHEELRESAHFVTESLGEMGFAYFCIFDADSAAFLSRHPGVQALHFHGEIEASHKLFQHILPWQKKIQAFLYGQSCYLSLDQIQLEPIRSFLENCELSEAPKRFYGLERFESENQKQLTEIFRSRVESITVSLSAKEVEKILAQIRSEGGEVIAGGEFGSNGEVWMQPTLIRNLSNCSDLYQRYLPLPIAFFHTIKYPFDIQKWLDQSSAHHGLFIQSDDEDKATQLSKKLKRTKIWVNRWVITDKTLLAGSNLSFGIQNADWNGEFFSTIGS